MCGIAGVWEPRGRNADPALARRMIEWIRHRGPDDCGVHVEGRASDWLTPASARNLHETIGSVCDSSYLLNNR